MVKKGKDKFKKGDFEMESSSSSSRRNSLNTKSGETGFFVKPSLPIIRSVIERRPSLPETRRRRPESRRRNSLRSEIEIRQSNTDYFVSKPKNLVSSLCLPNKDKTVELLKEGIETMNYDLRRPNYNNSINFGRKISLTINIVQVNSLPSKVHHYTVDFYPPRVPRSIMRKVFNAIVAQYPSIFTDSEGKKILPAYDAKSLLFTRSRLSFPNTSSSSSSSSCKLNIFLPRTTGGPDREYILTLYYINEIDIAQLTERLFINVHEIGLSSRMILDIILRHQPSSDYIPIGLNYFTSPGRYNLGCGREAWFGFHHNILPCNGKFGMVVDVASTAFFKEQSVLDFVSSILKRDCTKKKVSEDERKCLNSELIGLKVKTEHGKFLRTYRIQGLARYSSSSAIFDSKDYDRISVKDFFKVKYQKTLMYPDLPVLITGKGIHVSFLPMELCALVRGQRVLKKLTETQATTMIRMMASMAPERRSEVYGALKDLNLSQNLLAKEFNIKCTSSSIDEDVLMKADGCVLPPPSIEYKRRSEIGNDDVIVPNKGTWEIYDRQFKESRIIDEWAVLNLSPKEVEENKVRSLLEGLIAQGRYNGLELNEVYSYVSSLGNKDAIDKALLSLKKEKPNLLFLFVILDGKQTTYSHLKSKGDKELGLISQCIRWKSVGKSVMNNQVLSNLCMKINHKLGGVNCVISKVSKDSFKMYDSPLIILGATLSHPHHPEPRRPSVASLVGSIDAAPSQFTAYSSVQSRLHQHIVHLSEMVRSVLLDFYSKNGKLKPHRILFYRDAIRESMFLTITQIEINAIRRACLALENGYRPGITFIILQRRHNTRLFCSSSSDASGRSGNVPAGTCLDNTITHPNRFDFYLASHYGIQGTSRPTYYRVMWDDNQLSAQEAQSLTYMMCYCYSRCTRSVSMPAPTYYAHLAAVRSRHYLTDGDIGIHYDEQGLPIYKEDVLRAEQVLNVHQDNKFRMYFT